MSPRNSPAFDLEVQRVQHFNPLLPRVSSSQRSVSKPQQPWSVPSCFVVYLPEELCETPRSGRLIQE